MPNKVLYALCQKIYTRSINKYGKINNPFYYKSTGVSVDDYISVLNLVNGTELIDIDFVYNCIKLNEDNFKKNEINLLDQSVTMNLANVNNEFNIINENNQKYQNEIDSLNSKINELNELNSQLNLKLNQKNEEYCQQNVNMSNNLNQIKL